MKTVHFFIFFSLTTSLISAQSLALTNKYTHSSFNQRGQIIETKTDAFELSSVFGSEFYARHFNSDQNTPKHVFEPSYKNQTRVQWNDSTKVKNYQNSWNYTLAYDSLSRLTSYTYSGCIICAQLPFQIKINYDSHSRPSAIRFRHSPLINGDYYLEYYILYEQNGKILQVKKYAFGKIEEQFDRL